MGVVRKQPITRESRKNVQRKSHQQQELINPAGAQSRRPQVIKKVRFDNRPPSRIRTTRQQSETQLRYPQSNRQIALRPGNSDFPLVAYQPRARHEFNLPSFPDPLGVVSKANSIVNKVHDFTDWVGGPNSEFDKKLYDSLYQSYGRRYAEMRRDAYPWEKGFWTRETDEEYEASKRQTTGRAAQPQTSRRQAIANNNNLAIRDRPPQYALTE